jgi:ubiquinone/menaquinone biosynthesis C-methylase UbiE
LYTSKRKIAAAHAEGLQMTTETYQHWDRVYAMKAPTDVSWFQARPTPSLSMVLAAGTALSDSVIDVGAGASALMDILLEAGFTRLTALDVSDKALAVTRARLGDRGTGIEWIAADVTRWSPPADAYDLWHDRAVFHFLIDDEAREAYLRALKRGLRIGGHLILAPFSLSGPERCSGLPVQRYSPAMLQVVLGRAFDLVEARAETHFTPGGAHQDFIWCLFRRLR